MNEDSESGRTRQRLRDRLREATLREIMTAAEEVFGESGLDAATMAQIAERAGVAVGTLYNRFADRDALLEALLSERLEQGVASSSSAFLRPGSRRSTSTERSSVSSCRGKSGRPRNGLRPRVPCSIAWKASCSAATAKSF